MILLSFVNFYVSSCIDKNNQLLPALCLGVMCFIQLIKFITLSGSICTEKIIHFYQPYISKCSLLLIKLYKLVLAVVVVEKNNIFSCQPYAWVSCAEKQLFFPSVLLLECNVVHQINLALKRFLMVAAQKKSIPLLSALC